MLHTEVRYITPTDTTHVLTGPEGLVWEQPGIGDPVILAANTDAEQAAVAQHVAGLLSANLVPYGLPLTHMQTLAMFGGHVLRNCEWVRWDAAPAPTGDDPLPTRYAVIVLPEPQRTQAAGDLITIREAADLLGISTQAVRGHIDRGNLTAYQDRNEPNPQRRTRVRRGEIEALRS